MMRVDYRWYFATDLGTSFSPGKREAYIWETRVRGHHMHAQYIPAEPEPVSWSAWRFRFGRNER